MYFYKLLKPKVFWGSEGIEAAHDKGFEASCVVLSQRISRDPKRMSVMEFLVTLEELKEQNKKEQALSRRGR